MTARAAWLTRGDSLDPLAMIRTSARAASLADPPSGGPSLTVPGRERIPDDAFVEDNLPPVVRERVAVYDVEAVLPMGAGDRRK